VQIPDILRNKLVQIASAGIVAFVGGTGLGYVIGKRQAYRINVESQQELRKIISSRPRQESVERIEDFLIVTHDPEFEALLDEEEDAILTERNINLKPIEQRICVNCGATNGKAHWVKNSLYYCDDCIHLGKPKLEESDEEEPEVVHIFAHNDRSWDYDVEVATREREIPYVIHQEEFINDEMGFRQETLTYYAGDDIMSDTDDTPIYNYAGLMGELKFGHGSRDPNVVYIRNEVIHMEWEILLNPGMFSEEVLGLQMEKDAENDLRHSVQKFRRE
jgi:hypothetical protein